jgi:hypothetical protein
MPLDFPNNPTTNQTYTSGSTTWKYDGEKWILLGPIEPKIQVTSNSPSAPSSGAMWVDSDNGSLYVYYDGFWVAPNINYSIGTSAISDGAVTYSKLAAQTIDTKSDSYTLLTADAGKLIAMNKSTAQTVTVNGTLDLAVGQKIDILQTGAGQVTVSGSGATVNGTPGLKFRAQYSAATLLCTAADTYILIGDLSA